MQEGVAAEASSLAGHLGPRQADHLLRRQRDPAREPGRPRDERGRRQALRGVRLARARTSRTPNDLDELESATREAMEVEDQPSLVIVPSHIGFGSPEQAGLAPRPTARRSARTRSASPRRPTAGTRTSQFLVPDEALAHFRECVRRRARSSRRSGRASSTRYKAPNPEEAASCSRRSARARCPTAGTRTCRRFDADAEGHGHARGVRQGDQLGGEDGARTSSAARPTWRARTTPTSTTAATSSRATSPAATSTSACASTAMGAIVNGLGLAGAARVRRHVPDVLRLHARGDPPGGADEAAVDLRVDARLDRPRRGRPDPPVGRAPGRAAGDPAAATCCARATPTRPRSAWQLRAQRRPRRRRRSPCRGRTCRRSTPHRCPTTRSSAAPTC